MKKPVCVSPHQYGSISYRSCHNYTFKFKLRRKITHLFPIHQTIPHFSAKINNQPSPSCLQLSLLSSIPVRLADQFPLISVQFAQIHVPPPKYFYDNCCPLLIIAVSQKPPPSALHFLNSRPPYYEIGGKGISNF